MDFGFRILGYRLSLLSGGMRIIVFSMTAFIQLAAAAFGLFILLVGLNGYSERQATPALIAYLLVGLATVPGMGALGVMAARSLVERRGFGKAGASVGAIFGASVLGVVILVVGVIVAFVMAEVLRRMR